MRLRLIVGALALLGLVLLLSAVRSCGTARTVARVVTNQRDAAVESGRDAVQAVGSAAAREHETAEAVRKGTDAIRAAPLGRSNDAALRATCELRSYRRSKQCVELLGPIAD